MVTTRCPTTGSAQGAPTCATGPWGRLVFVVGELRELAGELRTTRRTTKEQH